VIGRHIALVGPLSTKATAGVVLHTVPDRRFDHYVAYAPLTTLPGWGVTLEQSRDVVVALPQRLRALILTVGLLMLLAGGTVAWLDVRRVVTPLRALAREAERIGSGDLATPIRVAGQDEISVLAESLDRMRVALRDSLEEIQRRETRAQALHEVGTGILRSREDEGALDVVVREACRLLSADVALLCLYDAQTQRVRPAATAGAAEAILAHGAVACPPAEIIGCAILSREYRVGHLVAPVQAATTLLGWLCVGTKTARAYTDDDRTLLESLGTLAALALENLRLRAEVRWLGTIQERERLARELHDGLAQALGVVYAYSQRRADDGSARRSLERIAEISSRAYEEVRQAIYGLRLTRHADLAAALGEYLREFTKQTGLPVDLRIEDPRATGLPMETEVQAVRIVQEALANVWRHAHATRATVHFALEGDEAVVSIEDNGVGFAIGPIGEGRRHFGLMTMRERAESVGGKLTITSDPGKGTRITARLPLAEKEVASWIRSG
jgi:nitrate/nitrite-specific signal transduction histidine kinase